MLGASHSLSPLKSSFSSGEHVSGMSTQTNGKPLLLAAVENFLVNSADFSKAARELQACWEEIGYSRDDLKTIQDGTIDALIQPLDKVVKTSLAHEKEQLAQHRNAVAECRVRVTMISAELSIPVFQVDENLPLIEKSRVLTQKAESLEAMREQLMSRLEALIHHNRDLYRIMHTGHYVVDENKVPTAEDLKLFSSHNDNLEIERKVREKRLKEVRSRIVDLQRGLEKRSATPPATFPQDIDGMLADTRFAELANEENELREERRVLHEEISGLQEKIRLINDRLKLEISEEFQPAATKVTPSYRNNLQAELKRLEVLKAQNIKKFIEEVRQDILELYEKCFSSAMDREDFSKEMSSTRLDEELLQKHEQHYQRLVAHFEKNEDFFKKIRKREEVWKKKMEIDEKENDPSRFKNRGGQMLQHQQEKAKIEHDLKKLDAELAKKLEQWLADHGEPFTIFGNDYAVFIKQQFEAYKIKLQREKEERKQAKEQDNQPPTGVLGKRKNDARQASANNGGRPQSRETHGSAQIGVAGLMERSPKTQRLGH
ncbi:hypothetical protein RvY_14451 [Ramazzottius varieornatus]|uniref:Protein regulator of cytokinesis 1 n=1 Tax=Ramazzottius varieornatus TaxID=947166 RepID=A0A1D1VV55_RAMVA|nr:hypothetical protein RvY_14451 [Ramazzottius varieornatus]